MDTLYALGLDSLKALVLMTAAAGLVLLLRGRAARVRAVVWASALTGSLLIPMMAPLLPVWSLPLPVVLTRYAPGIAPTAPSRQPVPTLITIEERHSSQRSSVIEPAVASHLASWPTWLFAIWAVGTGVLLTRQGVGLWRMVHAVRRSRPITDPAWLDLLERTRARVRCRRRVRLVVSSGVEIPATVGVIRPTVVIPAHSDTWLYDRREAVLLHELVHVSRLDWPMRVIARMARAIYWFNPLAWWAVRRLDLEQELACDEEVLALGTRASSYACHLLGVARAAVLRPTPAIAGLEMARRSHLEQRIMTILDKTTHRRARLALLLPATVLMAAMVPALAAVHPGDPPPRAASPELRQIMTEMHDVEARMEPHLQRIEELEKEIEPQLEKMEGLEVEIDHERLAAIELEMQPYLERIEEIEIDMEPFAAQLEALEITLEDLEIHVDDENRAEIQQQIQEQITAHMEDFEGIHLNMESFHEQMEAIHLELEPLHEKLEELHHVMEPSHEELERLHASMEPFHKQMQIIHEEMEPFHKEMERLGDRLHAAIGNDVLAVLRENLGPVTAPAAPLNEAAARVVEEARVRINDDLVRVSASPGEVRQILEDLLAEHRVGTQQGFDDAVDAATRALSPLEIVID